MKEDTGIAAPVSPRNHHHSTGLPWVDLILPVTERRTTDPPASAPKTFSAISPPSSTVLHINGRHLRQTSASLSLYPDCETGLAFQFSHLPIIEPSRTKRRLLSLRREDAHVQVVHLTAPSSSCLASVCAEHAVCNRITVLHTTGNQPDPSNNRSGRAPLRQHSRPRTKEISHGHPQTHHHLRLSGTRRSPRQ